MTGSGNDLARKHRRLRAHLGELGSLVVGLSGGVDSALLARVAHDVLGERMVAVIGDSPSLPRRELSEAVAVAESADIPHLVVPTAELDDPDYAANPADRCYFCRAELFGKLHEIAAERGFRFVAYGENVSDATDHRPGARAARERHVRAPLKEVGLAKPDVRALASELGLPVAEKPEYACLASRIPHGTPVTSERLSRVEAAEDALRDLGLGQLRVRHHEELARIEVSPADMPLVLGQAETVVARLRAVGYRHVTLDLDGYRRGSLNGALLATIPRRA